MFVANDVGYQQLLPEEEEIDERDSFFNSVAEYGFSHSSCQYRFCLPGQNNTDEYKRQILGFFKNEPCLYNHHIFGYAATFFDAMKHPDEAFIIGNLSRPDGNQAAKAKVRSSRRQSNQSANENRNRLPEIEFGSEKEKRLTYQLLFQTLKCKRDT